MEPRSRRPVALTACQGCRKLKMRCVRSNVEDGACDRCQHNRRPCEMPRPRQFGRKPGALGRYHGLEKARRNLQWELEKLNRPMSQKQALRVSSISSQLEYSDGPPHPMPLEPTDQTVNTAAKGSGVANVLELNPGCLDSAPNVRIMTRDDSPGASQDACSQPQIHKPAALMADVSGAVRVSGSSPLNSHVVPNGSSLAHRLLRNPGYVALGLQKLSRHSLEQGLGRLLVPEDQIFCKYPNYFAPVDPKLQRDTGMDVDPLELGLATMEEVNHLFAVYFDRIHPFIGILDPLLHTVDFVRSRSALLLTWILAVAAQFDHNSGALAKRLRMHGERLSKHVYKCGYKSVEIIQGYYISFLARSPAPSLSEEHSWIYTSYALALAAELELDQPTPACGSLPKSGHPAECESSGAADVAQIEENLNERQFRDRLARNRERTWLRIFLWERAQSAIIGRVNGFSETDLTLSIDSWALHPLADPVDQFTVAFVHLRRILATVQSELKFKIGLQTSDPHWVQKTIDHSLDSWCRTWIDSPSDNGALYEINRIYLRHVYAHGRLWALSCALHAYLSSGLTPECGLTGLREDCFNTAIRCCEDAVYDLESTGEPLYCMLTPTWAMLSYAVIMALTLFPVIHSSRAGQDVELLSLAAQVAIQMERAGTTPPHRFGISALLGQHLQRILRGKASNLQGATAATSATRSQPTVPHSHTHDEPGMPVQWLGDEYQLYNTFPFHDNCTSMPGAESGFSDFLHGLSSPGFLF